MNDSKERYPYLELDIIDLIYNYIPNQYATTDEILQYIRDEYGAKEYNNLKAEAEKRFKYTTNNTSDKHKRFCGFMPIEYIRDLILACFFLNSDRLDAKGFTYCTDTTLKSNGRGCFTFINQDVNQSDTVTHNYRIHNLDYILASNGTYLFAGFKFELKSPKDEKVHTVSRIYGTSTRLSIRSFDKDDETFSGVNIKYTGISGLRDGL